MDKWKLWLDSIASKGGNILVLLVINLCLGSALMHVLHHPEINAEARALVLSSFSGAFGALLFSLQNGGGQRKADSNGTNVQSGPAAAPPSVKP